MVAGLVAVSAARLAIAPAFELFPQEAYYLLYARHPALSYFDHPPLIGWILWLFTAALGRGVLAARLCAFSLTLATELALLALVREAVPPARQRVALLFVLAPVASVVSLIATPDVPLLLFWTLALLSLWRAVARAPGWFAVAGVCMGLAFDSKYTGAWLPLAAGAFLWLDAARDRTRPRWLRTPWPWVGLALALAVASPVVIWNAAHGFASFRFQTLDRAAAAPGLQSRFLVALIATQAALIGIPLLVAILDRLLRLPRQLEGFAKELQRPALFFGLFALPALGFFALSLFAQVKPNWLFPFFLAGVPFAALTWPAPRRLLAPSLACFAVVQVAAGVELLAYPVPVKSDDTFVGWKELAGAVQSLVPEGGFIFAADGYKTSAELEVYLDRKVYAGNILGQPALQYDYLGDDLGALRGRDALFLDSQPTDLTPERSSAPAPSLEAHFARVEQLDPIRVSFHGRVARKFLAYLCRGYRGP